MTIDEMKEILREYEKNKTLIPQKIEELKNELFDTDEIIRSISFPNGLKNDEDGGYESGMHRDLLDILLIQEKIQQDYQAEIIAEIRRLFESMEKMKKVYRCYLRLNSEEYQVIRHMYILQEPVEYVSECLDLSISTLRRRADSAFKHMVDSYNAISSMED